MVSGHSKPPYTLYQLKLVNGQSKPPDAMMKEILKNQKLKLGSSQSKSNLNLGILHDN